MPWTNRVRENSGLRILFLPPPPPPTAPPAPRGESLPATCLCMIDSSTRFNDFFPFLMLRQSGAGQVAQILSGYCGETKANWDWGDVAWQERQWRISLLRSVRGEMPNKSIVFTYNFFLQYLCNFSLADWWRAIISENNNFGNDSMMAQFVYLCLSRATVWETLTVNFIVKKKTYNNFPWSMLFLTLKWRQNAKKFGSFCRNQTIEFSGGFIAKL